MFDPEIGLALGDNFNSNQFFLEFTVKNENMR